jgi:hypothetical protein
MLLTPCIVGLQKPPIGLGCIDIFAQNVHVKSNGSGRALMSKGVSSDLAPIPSL